MSSSINVIIRKFGTSLPGIEQSIGISSFQLVSRVWLFVTPWTVVHQASLSITNSLSLLKLMSIASVMPPNHLILCCPLLLLPLVFLSIRVFSSESVLCIRWPKYWSFSFSISPYNEYSGLISFRVDWFDLLAVQRTLKSLLQHQSLKALILQRSAFFMVQLSHPYMTTGKTIALTRQNFVGKVMSLLFDMLSGFVITFLPNPIMRSPSSRFHLNLITFKRSHLQIPSHWGLVLQHMDLGGAHNSIHSSKETDREER